MFAVRFLCLLVLAPGGALFAQTPTAPLEAVIAKARSYLGAEADLQSLKSVEFEGTMETVEPGPDGGRAMKATLKIVFQQPYQQRIELTAEDRVEVTALNDFEGWQRIQTTAESQGSRLTLLGKDQIRRLRAYTWENLAFYRGLAERGGRVEDLGEADVGGVVARKVAFIHAESIVFYRYFDAATGRLVLTETEKGGQIREEGELIAGGIRFPAKIITVNKLADGTTREVVVSFSRVAVNVSWPDRLFAVPPISSR